MEVTVDLTNEQLGWVIAGVITVLLYMVGFVLVKTGVMASWLQGNEYDTMEQGATFLVSPLLIFAGVFYLLIGGLAYLLGLLLVRRRH